MSDIMRKVVFMLVLAGLLTWGAATMAQRPSVSANISSTGTELQGHVVENAVPVSRDAIRPF